MGVAEGAVLGVAEGAMLAVGVAAGYFDTTGTGDRVTYFSPSGAHAARMTASSSSRHGMSRFIPPPLATVCTLPRVAPWLSTLN